MKVPSTASSLTRLIGVPVTSSSSRSRSGIGRETVRETLRGPSRSPVLERSSSCVSGSAGKSAGRCGMALVTAVVSLTPCKRVTNRSGGPGTGACADSGRAATANTTGHPKRHQGRPSIKRSPYCAAAYYKMSQNRAESRKAARFFYVGFRCGAGGTVGDKGGRLTTPAEGSPRFRGAGARPS